jgi:hypothetical protein
VPVPLSTYCTLGAVKYWEYAQQYLGGYGIVAHYVVRAPPSTYCTHGTVTYWEYDSTLEATVQRYVVCVPSSTYCTHGAVKYWEYARQYLGGYGITLRCACTVVDTTTWCHAQHHIECSILCLAPLPFHLPFHQQGHSTVFLGCEVLIVLLSVNKIVVLNRCFIIVSF